MSNVSNSSPELISTPVPSGAPAWITAELIADTISTWQPYYEGPLTPEDALEILLDVGRLIDLLEQPHVQAVSGPRPGVVS